MLCFAHFLTGDETPHEVGISENFFLTRTIEVHETMAENAEREPDLAAIFKDSGDEGSFNGLRVDIEIMIVIVM